MSAESPDASPQGRRREDAHLRQLETIMRRCIERTRDVPLNVFPIPVEEMLRDVRPILDQLDSVRLRRARPRRVARKTKLRA